MKKVSVTIFGIGTLILGALFLNSHKANAISAVVRIVSNTSISGATTTAPYLVNAAASSTLGAFSLDSVSAIQLFMWSAASSSATKFTATIEYSNDGNTWYPYETASSTLLTSGSGAPPIVVWTPGAATTSKSIFVTGPNLYAARYGRIQYQLLGANGQVYLEAALKQN